MTQNCIAVSQIARDGYWIANVDTSGGVGHPIPFMQQTQSRNLVPNGDSPNSITIVNSIL